MANHRTVLISENRLFREGIRQILEKKRIAVVGEGRNIVESLQSVRDDACPEMVIFHLDPRGSDAAPLELICNLSGHFADAKLVVLADPSTKHLLPSFVSAGASAILLTEISSETFERSLELVLSDHRLFPAEIMSTVTGGVIGLQSGDLSLGDQAMNGHLQPSCRTRSHHFAQQRLPLSRREYQVVRCLAIGLPNKAIARELNITEGTIKVHVKALLRKTKARNRTQLAIWALRESGLFGSDEANDHDAGPHQAP